MPTTITKTSNSITRVNIANAVDWVPSVGMESALQSAGGSSVAVTWPPNDPTINSYRLKLNQFGFNLPSNADVTSFDLTIRTSKTGFSNPSIIKSNISIYNSTAPDSDGYKNGASFIFGGSSISISNTSFSNFVMDQTSGTRVNYLIGSGSDIVNRWNSSGLTLEFSVNGDGDDFFSASVTATIDQVTLAVTYDLIALPAASSTTSPSSISFDSEVDPRRGYHTTLVIDKVQDSFTYISFASNDFSNHRSTNWQFKTETATKPMMSFSTNDNGIIRAKHKFSNISIATKNKLGILLNRQYNWKIRFKQNNGNWSDWTLLDLSRKLRLLGYRNKITFIKTLVNGRETFTKVGSKTIVQSSPQGSVTVSQIIDDKTPVVPRFNGSSNVKIATLSDSG